MTQLSKRAWATIDLGALNKNLCQVKAHCPNSKIIPVVKSNAYGHGLEQVAKSLVDSEVGIAALAVATIDEALQLQALELNTPVLLLPGFASAEELELCINNNIELLVQNKQQMEVIANYSRQGKLDSAGRVWVKLNTGMNRLGLSSQSAIAAFNELHKNPKLQVVLMSHLACADDPQGQAAIEFTSKQLAVFDAVRDQLTAMTQQPPASSLAASAGILALPASHHQFVRPGIMLYGGSPLLNQSSDAIGLSPVMTLSSRVIAINALKAGESVGYGATYVCEHDTQVGVVAIGYGDGYPRSVIDGTQVLLKASSSDKKVSLIGRVSMDMITIDLTNVSDAQIGDEVVLWGEGLPADEVAKSAGTISYELFCQITKRISFEYRH